MMRLIRAEKARRVAEAERERVARDAERIRARCQTLAGFVREAWHVLEPTAKLVWNWHLDALCAHLEAITHNRMRPRLLANVPPGSSKSFIVSVMWQAWEWGPAGLPSTRYLTTAFNEGPVKRDTRKCRDLILSEWYQALWPMKLPRTGETSFANAETGTREGVPFGSLTSQRGDRLIIDDPHSTETAESAADRTATTRKFREGALNRLNDQERSAIVVIMQRLHEDDVSGVIMKFGMDFVHLCLPMEFEPDRRCETEIGFRDPRESDGELLDPVRFPRHVVDGLRRDIGSYAFAGQYQQRPAPREGGMFRRHWFETVSALPADVQSVRAWDFAATASTGSNNPDWTVGLRMSRDRSGFFYIDDVVRLRGSAHEVERALLNTAARDGNRVRVRIPQDAGQAGKGQAEYLVRQLAGYSVTVERETGDKEVRAMPFAAQCEAGNVKLVGPDQSVSWIGAFLDEIGNFPMGTHDDQVDAASGAFKTLSETRRLVVSNEALAASMTMGRRR